MKITVINGTEKRGVTYRLKEIFLSEFREIADITEYSLPKDCPAFCTGCVSCILKVESCCKGHQTQPVLVGDFSDWHIYRRFDGGYCLG